MVRIVHETDTPPDVLEALLDTAIGHDRKTKTAYRLRDGVSALSALSFAAYDGDRLVGTIRFWPAQVADPGTGVSTPILVLGPLAVAPDLAGQGIGVALMKAGLDRASQLGHEIVILVGDLPYYERVGFRREGATKLELPGPVDQDRLLLLELSKGAAIGLAGMVQKADPQAWSDGQTGIVPKRGRAAG